MPKTKAHASAVNGADVGRRYATPKQAAAYAQVSERLIRLWDADGLITGYRVGRRIVRYDLNEIDALMAGDSDGAA